MDLSLDLGLPQRWLVTGRRGAGKTTFCRQAVAQARQAGWQAAGVLSPAVFTGERKTGIRVEDVRTGESRLLAAAAPEAGFDLALGDWYFDRGCLEWGNAVLAASPPCDLLVIDELGPLELKLGQGWTAALDLLRRPPETAGYRLALVVVRPELEERAREVFGVERKVEVG